MQWLKQLTFISALSMSVGGPHGKIENNRLYVNKILNFMIILHVADQNRNLQAS